MADLFASPLSIALAALVMLALFFLLKPLAGADPAAADLRRRRQALDHLKDDLDPADYLARKKQLDRELAAMPAGKGIPRSLLLALIIALPLATLMLYGVVGKPDGINPPASETSQLRAMLGDLTDTVKRNPTDVEAWAQLGMIWKSMQQFPAAESAFRRVLFNEPDNGHAAVELAETLMYRSGQPHLTSEGRQLLAEVLARDPDAQKALWLSGMDALQMGRSERAVALWSRLEQQLPEGRARDSVRAQIMQAGSVPDDDVHAGLAMGGSRPPVTAAAETGVETETQSDTPAPAPASSTADGASGASSSDAEQPVQVAVSVSLAPALADRMQGNETLFIFARAVNGPPAPLAVKRMAAGTLPVEVVLSELDAMAPGMTLATFPEVQITARISRTGNVVAGSGDLEGRSSALDARSVERVEVQIDQVLP
ncbi:MAG: hypothetical protein RQ729_03115 [Wenzhouxiangellaceae bacterium]|nr:hypothetical protein [Wenzhouxiangellaceae bacterium]